MDEQEARMEQRITGNFNAIVQGGGTAQLSVLQHMPSLPPDLEPDTAILESAKQLLATLPVDELPEPAPERLPARSRMPLQRNILFTGRERELQSLARHIKGEQTVAIGYRGPAAATGIGGIGKTQLATEFVYRYGPYFAGGVFWLDCSRPENMFTEVLQCRGALLPEVETRCATLPPETQVQWIRQAWQTSLPRLLIFDNCEDEEILQQWQPRGGGCHIIVTSRRQKWSPEWGVKTVLIEALPRAESISLLWKYRSDLSAEEAGQIAEELGDHPLALSLAGNYLRIYRDVVFPSQYIQQVRQQKLQHRSLQGRGIYYSPTEHELHVARTFAMSYERLGEETCDAVAKEILACAAWCFAGVPIPTTLLKAAVIDHKAVADEEQVLLAEDALNRLLDLGLLEQMKENTVRMHRLVVYFVLANIDEDGQSGNEGRTAREQIAHSLFQEVERINAGASPLKLVPLQAHAMKFIQDAKDRNEEDNFISWSVLLGTHWYRMGAYRDAEKLYREALEIQERVHGREHPSIARTLNKLGLVCKEQGMYTEAEQYYKEALSIREKVYGRTHHTVATILNNLGTIYKEQGMYAKAEVLCKEALEIRRNIYGSMHSSVAKSMHNLGRLYREQGKYTEAEKLYKEALEIKRQQYGKEHASVATSLNNLGSVYRDQGKYTEAEEIYKEALEIRARIYGKEHPSIARSLNNLGLLYRMQARYEEAEQQYKKALMIWEKVYGKEHPDVATGLNNLAMVYDMQGRNTEAEKLYREAISLSEKLVGMNHPDTMQVALNYTAFLAKQGRDDEANKIKEQYNIRQNDEKDIQ